MKFSKLILCKYLLSMEKEDGEIKQNQMITVNQSRIHSISPIPKKLPEATEVIHLNHHLVCPGLINTHTHLPMVLFRGLGDQLTLQKWLEDIIFPLEKQMIDKEFIRIGTELAIIELIKNGITTVCDMYFHTPVMAKLFDSYGLRALLAVDMLGLHSDWKKELDTLCTDYQNHARVYPAIGCHAPYTCSPSVLKRSVQESEKRNLPISIHVSETQWEVSEIQKKYGTSPVSHLKNCGLTGSHCLFVHCVHLTEQDMNILSETNTPISYNPESNMKLGSGIAPILKALERDITVGLGTDGAASNNNLNLFTEMDTAAKLQKLKYPSSVVHTKDIFSMVTTSAAKALGLSHLIGKIHKGFSADIIALDLNHPHLYPKHDLLNHIVYSASGYEVDFVMCNGRILMKNSIIQGIDLLKIYKEAEKMRDKITRNINQ